MFCLANARSSHPLTAVRRAAFHSGSQENTIRFLLPPKRLITMKLTGALIVLCIAQAIVVHATLSGILAPFRHLLGWGKSANQTKTNRLGEKSPDTVTFRPSVDGLESIGTKKLIGDKTVFVGEDAQGHPMLLLEDFKTTMTTESPKVSLLVSSPSLTTSTSEFTTSSAAPSGHSTSVEPTTDHTISDGSVAAPSTEANRFHLIDLKIPGGEDPDSEILPDVADFKPLDSKDIETKVIDAESQKTDHRIAFSSTPTPTDGTTASTSMAPAKTTASTSEIVVTAGSPETVPISRTSTEERTRQSDRFVQSIHIPEKSVVVQDVNDLFQSED
ncbi:uncharacterized protein LOC100900269 [Galendromus occidentalis]|uniref:Uncharacterized protein LOC100900269 n=1 Tax=Galendromus occidentalis TaxID=34638 RepID=A0AAJ6QUR4_9ACAR|nr:uncharacterized protein LOC100900269 [Galendromus occidentalis]